MATQTVDVAHSEIAFSVRHMMFSKVRGNFKKWDATLSYDASDPLKSSVDVDIEVASIDTRDDKRDGHLRSPDFFDSEKYPTMQFKSKRIEPAGKARYRLVGDLTIHGATHELVLDVEQTGGGKDPWGNERIGFSAKGSINRGEWGLVWNQVLEAGAVLVSDKVEIEVEAEVIVGAKAA